LVLRELGFYPLGKDSQEIHDRLQLAAVTGDSCEDLVFGLGSSWISFRDPKKSALEKQFWWNRKPELVRR
jgi:hypothetical protein